MDAGRVAWSARPASFFRLGCRARIDSTSEGVMSQLPIGDRAGFKDAERGQVDGLCASVVLGGISGSLSVPGRALAIFAP